MRWILVLSLLFSGCAGTTKSTVSVFFEKDLWTDNDRYSKPDAKARIEYRLEQSEPWPFQPRSQHE